jgi:hypothetical protein
MTKSGALVTWHIMRLKKVFMPRQGARELSHLYFLRLVETISTHLRSFVLAPHITTFLN